MLGAILLWAGGPLSRCPSTCADMCPVLLYCSVIVARVLQMCAPLTGHNTGTLCDFIINPLNVLLLKLVTVYKMPDTVRTLRYTHG